MARTDGSRQTSLAELRERVAELERERELLNAIANTAPSLLCLIDPDGTVRPFATNKAFERRLEYAPVETGGVLFWERYVPTEDGPGLIREALGPGYRIQDWRELNRSLFSALKLEKIAMFLVLGIVILVASFSIVGNLIMVVVEKGREIALLKTLGASDMSLMLVFAIQGVLIGIIGTGLGVGTGLLACYLGKRFGIPLNPDVYYIDKMPVHVDPESVLVTAFAGVMISMAATFYPAFVAARVRPAAGMRH